jgi:hypothetical protein
MILRYGPQGWPQVWGVAECYPGNSVFVSQISYAYGRNILQVKAMKAALAKKPLIRIAVVGSDPLQFVGLRAVFDSERDFELIFFFIIFII